MLPVVIAGIGVAGLFLNKASSNNERAERMNAKAFNRMGEAQRHLMVQRSQTEKALIKLANRKKGIMASSFKRFVELYEQVIRIDVLDNSENVELLGKILERFDVQEMKSMVAVSGMAMTEQELVFTMLFSFKHGGILGSILKDSEINMQIASMRKKQANAVAMQSENEEIALKEIYDQAEAVSDVLAKLNLLFLKSMKSSEKIIEQYGTDNALYTNNDKKLLMTCINIAKAVKDVVDAPLFDDEGNIGQQIQAILAEGKASLNKFSGLYE